MQWQCRILRAARTEKALTEVSSTSMGNMGNTRECGTYFWYSACKTYLKNHPKNTRSTCKRHCILAIEPHAIRLQKRIYLHRCFVFALNQLSERSIEYYKKYTICRPRKSVRQSRHKHYFGNLRKLRIEDSY